LNYISIKKCINIQLDIKQTIVKPLTASLIMAIVGMNIFRWIGSLIGNDFGVLISIMMCIMVYFISLILIKGLTREELVLLPGGRKLISLFGRFV